MSTFGLPTFWCVDVLVCRCFGVSTFWFVNVLVCRRFGLSTLWFVDVLVCRRFGLWTFSFVDVLVVDVSVCRRFDQLPIFLIVQQLQMGSINHTFNSQKTLHIATMQMSYGLFFIIILEKTDGLVQERSNSIANALELYLCHTNPSQRNVL